MHNQVAQSLINKTIMNVEERAQFKSSL